MIRPLLTVVGSGFFSTRKFLAAMKICPFLVTSQTTIVQESWYFILSTNTLFAWLLGATNLIAIEIQFFLVSSYTNLDKLCVHFELTVGSPWTNLVKIWPIVVRWATYKTLSANYNSQPQIYLLVKMKPRHIREIWDTVFEAKVWKIESHINRFHPFVFGERELNEWKHLVLLKPPFLSTLKFYTF